VEIDGGVHSDLAVKKRDGVRTGTLKWVDIRVLRFGNEEIVKEIGVVVNKLRRLLLE
jgi:very-short-patch-repair endonuclease